MLSKSAMPVGLNAYRIIAEDGVNKLGGLWQLDLNLPGAAVDR